MLKAGKRPEIIHCHDWQTALVPVLLYEIYQQIGMRRPAGLLHGAQLQPPGRHGRIDSVGDRPVRSRSLLRLMSGCGDDFNPDALNLLKGGIVYSNFVTTVSPGHAWEVCYSDEGRGLGHTLHVHRRQVRRRAQRRRLRHLESGDRPADPAALRPRLDRGEVRQQAGPARAVHAARRAQADRLLRRPARSPEGRAPDPPRDLLRARAGRAVRAAWGRARTRRSAAISGISSITSTTIPTSTSSCSSAPSSRTSCTRGRTCW